MTLTTNRTYSSSSTATVDSRQSKGASIFALRINSRDFFKNSFSTYRALENRTSPFVYRGDAIFRPKKLGDVQWISPRNVGFHLVRPGRVPRDLLARHALYPRRPRRAALTRWLGTYSRATCWRGTRCTRAALGAWRSPDGSARAVPALPSARGAHQMARYAFPRDLLAERTEVPFGRYGKGRRRAVFRMCCPCFRIIILAFKDFAFHRSEAKSHVQPRKNPLNCRL